MRLSLRTVTTALKIDHSYWQFCNVEGVNFPRRFNVYVPIRWHIGHFNDHEDSRQRNKKSESIFRTGLAADIGLATGKVVSGYLSGSTAIIADAAHSISDVVLSGVALVSFKAGKAPKDKEHPYGHGKFESLGALGISSMLLATAGGIAWHALGLLTNILHFAPEMLNSVASHNHMDMNHPALALGMTIVAISVKEGLYQITSRAGEKQGSGLMKANAWHHRADAVSSVVALVGVGGSILGVKLLDPLAGVIVSSMILKAGLETGYQSILELVDAAISPELDPIKKTILQVNGVQLLAGMPPPKGTKSRFVHLLGCPHRGDPFLGVRAAHGTGEHVRQEIHESFPNISEAFIHIDPSCLSYSSQADALNNIETTARTILTELSESIEVQRVSHHQFKDKIFVQIEVSMTPHLRIEDAMRIAAEAEKKTLKAHPCIAEVCLLLRLGNQLPKQDLGSQK